MYTCRDVADFKITKINAWRILPVAGSLGRRSMSRFHSIPFYNCWLNKYYLNYCSHHPFMYQTPCYFRSSANRRIFPYENCYYFYYYHHHYYYDWTNSLIIHTLIHIHTVITPSSHSPASATAYTAMTSSCLYS